MALRILFVVTEDWYFRSHRLDLARRARDAGHDVHVATRVGEHGAELAAEGFHIHPIPFDRSLRSPRRDLAALRATRNLVHTKRPDIAHLVSLKPILIGRAALAGLREVSVVCAFTGLGYLFSSRDRLARLLRPAVAIALRSISRDVRSWVVAQNIDDRDELVAREIADESRLRVIPGSGVDLSRYVPVALPRKPLVVLPARLLRDKGVAEFVEAAGRLRTDYPDARFVLVGARDRDNPGAVAERELRGWIEEGAVEWWGHRDDMPAVYGEASIVCLPSWREGLPKALLEGAACGRALVATDVPGCREICVDGETGLCVPPRAPAELAAAIGRLLADGEAVARLGRGARARAERCFGIDAVARQTLALYEDMRRTSAT